MMSHAAKQAWKSTCIALSYSSDSFDACVNHVGASVYPCAILHLCTHQEQHLKRVTHWGSCSDTHGDDPSTSGTHNYLQP